MKQKHTELRLDARRQARPCCVAEHRLAWIGQSIPTAFSAHPFPSFPSVLPQPRVSISPLSCSSLSQVPFEQGGTQCRQSSQVGACSLLPLRDSNTSNTSNTSMGFWLGHHDPCWGCRSVMETLTAGPQWSWGGRRNNGCMDRTRVVLTVGGLIVFIINVFPLILLECCSVSKLGVIWEWFCLALVGSTEGTYTGRG